MTFTALLQAALPIGIGATLVMDLWAMLLRRLGIPTLNIAMLGRWAGHLLQGRVRHEAIAKSAPIEHELAWGWVVHYVIGVVFALILIGLTGEAWLQTPTAWPAVMFGVVSVVAPLCFMQPAMGAGFFASKTPTPARNCLKSLISHSVFGVGMFLSAALATLA